ncbi:unnamed protein product [Paramecium octaurelia]|uniref:non-specific serine/threonine protein kinase n=1 Tax=Paramecium octaurelia TaxID=43137 RepID=A0A8S1XLB3_PAROT|nr:unnamed protein product [Paramecium octaurelia]
MGRSYGEQWYESRVEILVVLVQNFQFIDVIGRGGFGKVWKVRQKKNKQFYTLKVMSKPKKKRLKYRIIQKKSLQSVMNEKTLLSGLKHKQNNEMELSF